MKENDIEPQEEQDSDEATYDEIDREHYTDGAGDA